MSNLWANVRLAWRLALFLGATLAMRVGMELSFLLAGRERRLDVINWWVPRWSSALLRAFGIRVEGAGGLYRQGQVVSGRDDRGVGRIFIANHRSGTDIPVAFTLVAAHAISRHDLATWPILGSGARRIGTLFVDRANRRSGAAALRQITDALAAGEGVLMFPEGTAYVGDDVREFKPGAFTTAARADAEIVPLGIAYGDLNAYYGRQSFLSHLLAIGRMRRLRVAVEIGSPLRLSETTTPLELKETARGAVQQLVDRARQRLGGPRHESPPPEQGNHDGTTEAELAGTG